jgi:hypothetical protein
MKNSIQTIVVLLTATLLAGGVFSAEPAIVPSDAKPGLLLKSANDALASEADPAPDTVPPKDDSAPPDSPRPILRDPTLPSEQMKALLGQPRVAPAAGVQASLPSLRIKGRVASSEGDVLVLLQVGQQLERVTADTEWTTEDGLTITVVSVSLTELRLDIQPLNRTVTIR